MRPPANGRATDDSGPEVLARLPGGASARRLDARLQDIPTGIRAVVIALTVLAMAWQALPFVPRDVVDLSRFPLFTRIHQQQTLGTDTIADAYEARVVLNDVRDMYTKRATEQTAAEARTWTRAASAPYPPALLLAEAAMFAAAGRTDTGFYLAVLMLAAAFLVLSLAYFARTRWYLFAVLYLNFGYIGSRFVGVQDASYLVMLVVIAAALLLARARRPLAHLLMAVAIILKLSPLYYATEIVHMRRRTAVVFVAIVASGLVLPYFIWDGYLGIYAYSAQLKGNPSSRLWAFLAVVPVTLVIAYLETRLAFDMEERIGWGLVPLALFFAIRMNVARHLLLVLLVPDKRGWRNVTAAIGLGLYAAAGGALPLGSVLSIVIGLLGLVLLAHLRAIGWTQLREDLRHPLAFARAWVAPGDVAARVV